MTIYFPECVNTFVYTGTRTRSPGYKKYIVTPTPQPDSTFFPTSGCATEAKIPASNPKTRARVPTQDAKSLPRQIYTYKKTEKKCQYNGNI